MNTIIGLMVAGVLSLLVSVSSMGGEIEDGLLAYWSFDRCDASDDSGNGHSGTLIGNPVCVEGAIDSAFQFDGIDDLIEIPDNPAFHFVNEITAAAWVAPHAISGLRTIISKWYTMDTFFLGIQEGNYTFAVAFPGSAWGQVESVTAPATVGVWTHVAGVFDGGRILLYINGELVSSKEASGALQDSIRPILIGNHPSWNAFEGAIDEGVLYNRALSGFEIHELFGVSTVTIDIRPLCHENVINPRRKGVIPVAIITTDLFDATTVAPATVRFGPTGTEAALIRFFHDDVDGDGDTDMIAHFKTQDSGIVCGDTSAVLKGETFGGELIQATDSLNTVGCKPSHRTHRWPRWNLWF
jgi:hypothetical protein